MEIIKVKQYSMSGNYVISYNDGHEEYSDEIDLTNDVIRFMDNAVKSYPSKFVTIWKK
jgi:hypothetical protein